MNKIETFRKALNERRLLLDGAMGTLLQQLGHVEKTPEVLNESHPEVIASVHQRYLNAGADIITTNTFSANRIALKDLNLAHKAHAFAKEGAMIARKVADDHACRNNKACFVAGSMGPTGCSLTLQLDQTVSFDDMASAYQEQAEGLIAGGVDILLLETSFDTLNVKAALQGMRRAMNQSGVEVPIWVSITLSDATGRMLAGQTIGEFYRAIAWATPQVVSLNCGMGPAAMKPYVKQLDEAAQCAIAIYPNAGLPNDMGAYEQSAADFVKELSAVLETHHLNIVGGCCGTTDEHISALRHYLDQNEALPQVKSHKSSAPKQEFYIVGERCNVWGSKKFKTYIEQKDYENALTIACQQITQGANIIDVNLDAPMVDARQCMSEFLSLFPSEPLLVGADVMIDSSDWEVVSTALRQVHGRVFINSISLKEGEDIFLKRAAEANDFGASIVVMAADEQGQASTYERRIEICERAYKLLVDGLNYPPERIIFDPNTFAICTGDEEHRAYAIDFLNTTKYLREKFKHVHIISGVSNISFAFRGNDRLRQAMHAVFIEQARLRGMDMAIINPQAPLNSAQIDSALKALLDDAIIHGHDVSAELIEWSVAHKESNSANQTKNIMPKSTSLSPQEQLENFVMKGQSSQVLEPVEDLLKEFTPLQIISDLLMKTMEKIGQKFASGEMYLPQILKSAQTMKQVVAYLSEMMARDKQEAAHQPLVLLATVEGDVHDIGKNICATVLSCNGFKVLDLGVMVKSQEIVAQAKAHKPMLIGLSGLITPSLAHMEDVASRLQAEGLSIPLFVGGATTSALHTALKLSPLYQGLVCWTNDASQLAVKALKLLNEKERNELYDHTQQEYAEICQQHQVKKLASIEEARAHKLNLY